MHPSIKVIKLTSGDTIVAALTHIKNASYVRIDNPVQFTMIYKGNSEGNLVASQWLETDETTFSIERSQIVASADPNDMLRNYYFSSLEEINTEIENDILLEVESGTLH